ncbi:PulJ/GspJ family protein [Acinetobacter sp. UBA801]|uniref:PulJ/GspJ family protein n=1 Tax=Acinetobacter sp. UBA801 TaxID=1945958 RepID=UPI0025B9AD5F|nr:prepilin-type N-terminal cleavage/methylation domain-containing protein [Acinetobacter sp. UBA801]
MQQVIYKSMMMHRHQQGATLIEVLVSMVLMAIIGLGAAYISGRTAVVHRDQNIHLHTVNQMRQQLEDSAECGGKAVGSHEVQIQVAGTTVNLNCVVSKGSYTVAAKDSTGGGVASSTVGGIKVDAATLAVKETDTFVPVKVVISP